MTNDEKDRLIDSLYYRISKSGDMITHYSYEKVLHEAADLRIYKVNQYGEERYEEMDIEVQLWMIYCDINRKFCRLKRLIKNVLHNNDSDSLKKLRSDLLDLLNYGAMGVQIIDTTKIKERLELK